METKLNSSECSEVITYMSTSHEPWECKHLSYLVKKSEIPGSGIATTLSCDLSTFSWKLLLRKQDLDHETVQAITSLGGKFAYEDIEQQVSDRNIAVLQLAMEKPKDYVQLFLEAVEYSKFEKAEEYLKEESQLNINDISLSSVLQIMVQRKIHTAKRRDFISFINKLLDRKIDPNRKNDGELCPLDVVLKLPSKDYQAERIELLTLLIEYGAAIKHCTYQKTLLHIATNLAIESGKILGPY